MQTEAQPRPFDAPSPQLWFPWFELVVLFVAGSQEYWSLALGGYNISPALPVVAVVAVIVAARMITGLTRGLATTFAPLGVLLAIPLCLAASHHVFLALHGHQLLHSAATGQPKVQPLGVGPPIGVKRRGSESRFVISGSRGVLYLLHAPDGPSTHSGAPPYRHLYGSWYRSEGRD